MFAADLSNPWIASAAGARRKLSPWIVLALAAAVAAASVAVGRLVGAAGGGLAARAMAQAPAPWPALVENAVFQLAVFGPLILFAVVACRIEGRRLWLPGTPSAALIGLVCGAGGFGLLFALVSLAGAISPGGAGLVGPAAAAGVSAGLVLFAFQCAAEEVYFRGWLQPLLCQRWGPWAGLAVSSLLFAALHLLGGARSPLALINLVLGGVMFGLLALRSGGLWAPFLAHFSWNWIEACGVGLEPNPGIGPTGALVDLDLGGAKLWSGGADDLNGSLATTLVLLSVTIALLALAPLRSAGPAARRPGFAPPQTT